MARLLKYKHLWMILQFLLPVALLAGPTLKVMDVETAEFPKLHLTVHLRDLYPPFVKRKEGAEISLGERKGIKLFEEIRGRERPLELMEMRPESFEAKGVVLSFVMDSTRSVSPEAFEKSLEDAQFIRSGLAPADRAVLFSFNGEPSLESGFTAEREEQLKRIRGIQRVGMKTRIYDALFGGVASVRLFFKEGALDGEYSSPVSACGTEGSGGTLMEGVRNLFKERNSIVIRPRKCGYRGAILLFTDGKDEGSRISPSTMEYILASGREEEIPVYVVLYGDHPPRERFEALAMETGGDVLINPDEEALTGLLAGLRNMKGSFFRITATSLRTGKRVPLPWEESRLRLEWDESGHKDEAMIHYTIPGTILLQSYLDLMRERPALSAGLLAALVVILIFLTFLFLIFRRVRIRQRKEALEEHLESTRTGPRLDDRPFYQVHDALASDDEAEERRRKFTEEEPDYEVVDDEEPLEAAAKHHDSDSYRPTQNEMYPDERLSDPERESDEGDVRRPKKRSSGRDREEYREFEKSDTMREPEGRDLPFYRVPPDFLENPDMYDPYMRGEYMAPSPDWVHSRHYIREQAYHLLQMALRRGVRYEEALLLKVRDPESDFRREYDIFLENTVLGSGRWANIRLDDDSVSPSHCRIRKVDNKYVVYDLMSGSGVYVNNRKVLRPRALTDGDELRVGRTVFRFVGRK